MCVYFSLIIALLSKLVSQSWGLNGSQSWHTSGGSKDTCHLVFFKLILPYDQLSKFILPDPDMKFMGWIDQASIPCLGLPVVQHQKQLNWSNPRHSPQNCSLGGFYVAPIASKTLTHSSFLLCLVSVGLYRVQSKIVGYLILKLMGREGGEL